MTRYTIKQLEERIVINMFMARKPDIDDSRYGKSEKLKVSSGRKIDVEYRREIVNYFVPSDAAWTTGGYGQTGIMQIDRAYRILEEKKGILNAKEVRDNCELESVASGYLLEMQRVLQKLKEKK